MMCNNNYVMISEFPQNNKWLKSPRAVPVSDALVGTLSVVNNETQGKKVVDIEKKNKLKGNSEIIKSIGMKW